MTRGTLRTGLRAASAVAALSLLLAAGCSSSTATSGTSSASKKANLAITFLPKNLGNAYFDTSDKGGKKAIDELGGTYAELVDGLLATLVGGVEVGVAEVLREEGDRQVGLFGGRARTARGGARRAAGGKQQAQGGNS